MKKYIIREDTLIELITNNFILRALECGGVDNWSWYGESLNQWLDELDEYDFEEVAKKFIDSFATEME